jgi:hypothetical protein
VIKKFRGVVVNVKRSNLKKEEMEKWDQHFSIQSRALVRDVVTRWNSCLYMLRSVLSRRISLEQTFGIDDNRKEWEEEGDDILPDAAPTVVSSDWAVIERIVPVRCAVLCCAVLCYAVLRCAVLCCAVLY